MFFDLRRVFNVAALVEKHRRMRDEERFVILVAAGGDMNDICFAVKGFCDSDALFNIIACIGTLGTAHSELHGEISAALFLYIRYYGKG